MSELRADSRPKNSTAFWRVYMLSWAVLAGGALTYLTVHTTPSGSLNSNLAQAPKSKQELQPAELDRQQLSAQVRVLNEKLASLRTDLARYKKNSNDRSETPSSATPIASPAQTTAAAPEQAVSQEVSNITTSSLPKPEVNMPVPVAETPKSVAANPVTIVNAAPSKTAQPAAAIKPAATTNPPVTTSPVATAPAPTAPVAEAQPSRRRNLATSLLRPGKLPPLPPYNFQRTAAVAPALTSAPVNTVATGVTQTARDTIRKPVSVVRTTVATQPQTTAFGAPVIKPRQPVGSAALSLSTAQSVTGLRASWLLLTTRHPHIFVGYQPRYVADQVNGNYRLLAGPIANHSAADRICTELRAQNVSCGVTAYVGSAL